MDETYKIYLSKINRDVFFLDPTLNGFRLSPKKEIFKYKSSKLTKQFLKPIDKYYFTDEEKKILHKYFDKYFFKDEIDTFIENHKYERLFITQFEKTSLMYLHREKETFIIDKSGAFSSVKDTHNLFTADNFSFVINLKYKQDKAIKKILNSNEYKFIMKFTDIARHIHTYPRPIGMPIPPDGGYIAKDPNRYLQGYGQLIEEEKPIQKIMKLEKEDIESFETMAKKSIDNSHNADDLVLLLKAATKGSNVNDIGFLPGSNKIRFHRDEDVTIKNRKLISDNLIIDLDQIASMVYILDDVKVSLKNGKDVVLDVSKEKFDTIKKEYLKPLIF